MSTVKNTPPFFYSTDFYEAEIGKCKDQTVTECQVFVDGYSGRGSNLEMTIL